MKKRYDYVRALFGNARESDLAFVYPEGTKRILRRLVREAVNAAIWGHLRGETDDELRDRIAKELIR